ncbi:MAG: putative peptidoglycan glycosyltransferase FtsW [Acidobacteriota bacterium]
MTQRVRLDWWLFLSLVGLVFFGLLMVWSASSHMAEVKYRSSTYLVVRQAAWAGLALGLMMLFMRLDYRKLNHPAWAFGSIAVVLMLLAVAYFVGERQRFLRVGPIGIQPSEFAKPALIVFLAYFVTLRAKTLNDLRTLAQAAMTIGLVAGAVMVPDLGTAAVLVVAAAVVFSVAGLQTRYFKFAALATAVLLVWAIGKDPYRVARVVSFLDPEFKILGWLGVAEPVREYMGRSAHGRNPNYHREQSLITVGSGGALGQGIMKGAMKNLYLPEAHNDFIYAVVGEELGLAGCAALVLVFLIILWRGARLARSALDDFGRYVALGVTTIIVVQAFINMSVVLGLAPTKGIPLPMISYGGSSLVSTLICGGMLLSVSERSG